MAKADVSWEVQVRRALSDQEAFDVAVRDERGVAQVQYLTARFYPDWQGVRPPTLVFSARGYRRKVDGTVGRANWSSRYGWDGAEIPAALRQEILHTLAAGCDAASKAADSLPFDIGEG